MHSVLVFVITLLRGCSALNSEWWHLNRFFPYDHVGASKILEEGGQLAFEHCQTQFKWHRWNCPKSVFTRWNQVAEYPPTREIAYVHGIISAGIMYSMIKNCSSDPNCRTNHTYKEQELYGSIGFEDNTLIGEKFTKQYLDSVVTGQDIQGMVNLHNVAVGRIIIRNTMVRKCQCHGVSGTCAMKTCWKKMPTFDVIAEALYKLYLNANKIDYELIGNSASFNEAFKVFSHVKKDVLIFMHESPNYCDVNPATGWPGTKGRICSKNHGENVPAAEKRSCRELCKRCGYQVRKRKTEVTKQCKCQFSWCCDVSCSVCKETVKEHYCF